MDARMGLVTAVAMGMVVTAVAGCATEPTGAVSGPMVVVLNQAPKPALHLIDLESGQEARRIALRSPAIDLDAGGGRVVTAQCGGVGTDADDVIGVYDAARRGRIRYFDSVAPNPVDITLLSSSTAVVSNGWMDEKGIVVSLVDVRRRHIVAEGRVPDMTDKPALVGGVLWAHSIRADGTRRQLRRIDPGTLRSVVVTEGPDAPVAVVGDENDPHRMFALDAWDRSARPLRVRLHPFDGSAASLIGGGRLYEFEDGPGRSAMIGNVLAIADFTDIDPQNHGTRVLLTRPGVSNQVRHASVPGGPAAICVWRGRFLVLESRTGRILAIDPETGAVTRVGGVPGKDRMLVDMAVID